MGDVQNFPGRAPKSIGISYDLAPCICGAGGVLLKRRDYSEMTGAMMGLPAFL